jgi:peroxiredoxin
MHRATENLRTLGILGTAVKVGDKAPEFSLRNTSGQGVTLSQLLSKGPVVLSFYRGRCDLTANMELEALAKATPQIEALGATLILISPQLEEHNQAMAEEKKLSVDILSDPGNEVAERYGIRFKLQEDLKRVYEGFGVRLDEYNGDTSWTLPMPARLIIDRDGIIRYAEINPDYTMRPDPEDTIEVLKKIIER